MHGTNEFWSLQCECGSALIMSDHSLDGVPVFRTKELAELAASSLKDKEGKHPAVIRIRVQVLT